ncbi:MAG: thioredoxin domain-containing protein [Caulobacteraceae bacterium]
MSRPALRSLLTVGLFCTLGSVNLAQAEVSRADLARVGVHTAAGAHAPMDLPLRDQAGTATTLGAALHGQTGVLVFQDYRCKTLCGPALAIVAAGVKASGLKPGRDFRLIALGLNPRETPADARAMQASRLGDQPDLLRGSTFLTGDAASIAAATAAMGFGYAYDPATDQFTHPVAAFVLSPTGLVTRVLPETALTGPDLRRAVLGADRGEVGGLIDTLRLLCHDLVPLTGRYDGPVQTGLRIGGVVTVLAMLGAGMLLFRRRTA